MQYTTIITGGTSFIGSNLAHRLIQDGWNVHILVRPNSSLAALDDIKDQLVVHTHDGTTENLLSIYEQVTPIITFHLAALTISDHTPSDICPLIQSNISFATQLLEAHYRFGVPYFINTGTYWQHYNNRAYSPVCLYAATKKAFEDIIQFYVEATGLKVITLKLFDTYGPNDTRDKLFYLLRQALLKQIPLPMSEGEQFLDLVYIDDVVEAYIVAADRLIQKPDCPNYASFEVSSGNPVQLKEVVHLFENELREQIPINWGERPYQKRQIMWPQSLGKKLPSWKSQTDLTHGIKELVRALKS